MFASATVLAFFASTADAHSWLVKPRSRETSPQVDLDGVVGCPNNTPTAPTPFAAGSTIEVSWWRNNHIGGFIRWAIVPKGQESAANFDNNVFHFTCRESGPTCKPNMPDKMYTKDGGPGDLSRYSWDIIEAHHVACGDKIQLPDWLPQGDYVLQWTWFGAGSGFDNFGHAEVTYRSCADITLTTDGGMPKPSCPTFMGGDRATSAENMPADQFFYYAPNNKIPSGQLKQDNNNYKQYYHFGKPERVIDCQNKARSTSTRPMYTRTISPESKPAIWGLLSSSAMSVFTFFLSSEFKFIIIRHFTSSCHQMEVFVCWSASVHISSDIMWSSIKDRNYVDAFVHILSARYSWCLSSRCLTRDPRYRHTPGEMTEGPRT